MASVDINNLDSIGLNRDQPSYQLPPEAWEVAFNMRYRNGGVERVKGYSEIFSGVLETPHFVIPVTTPSQIFWLYASMARVYVFDGLTHSEITRAAANYNTTFTRDWNSATIGGIPILNNGVDVPQAWLGLSPTIRLVDLPAWPTNRRATLMRTLGPYLIAMNITKDGSNNPNLVMWSNEADPGTVPGDWDIADPTSNAGEAPLNDVEAGGIVEALPLAGSMFIYKEGSIWRMRPVASRDVFDFGGAPVLNSVGALAPRCVTFTPDGTRHVFASQDDIYVFDGASVKSVLTSRMRRTVFGALEDQYHINSFMFSDREYQEVWFCYPEKGHQIPTRALVWNYVTNALSEAEVDFGNVGSGPVEIVDPTTWDADTERWDSEFQSGVTARLFPTGLPKTDYTTFTLVGYEIPVTGVIWDLTHQGNTLANMGVPVGGVGTQGVEVSTLGLWGYSWNHGTVVPHVGPLNLPVLGMQVDNGAAWVMCRTEGVTANFYGAAITNIVADPTQYSNLIQARLQDLLNSAGGSLTGLVGVQFPTNVEHFGHYPVADFCFTTSSVIECAMRVWNPLVPGDLNSSMLPGGVFEVTLYNTDLISHEVTLAFNYPGIAATYLSSGAVTYVRSNSDDAAKQGVLVSAMNGTDQQTDYFLGVLAPDVLVRRGAALDGSGAAWANVHNALPATTGSTPGASVTVSKTVAAGTKVTVRFLLTWWTPRYNTGGFPRAPTPGTAYHVTSTGISADYTFDIYHQKYATTYVGAVAAADVLAANYGTLWTAVARWQQVVYSDGRYPGWLQYHLINSFHSYPRTLMYADGSVNGSLVAERVLAIESPRGDPAMGTLDLEWWGNYNTLFFFPTLALNTLRAMKAGIDVGTNSPPMLVGGGSNTQAPFLAMTYPTRGYHLSSAAANYIQLCHRYILLYGGSAEFYTSMKNALNYVINAPAQGPTLASMLIDVGDWNFGGEPKELWEGYTFYYAVPHIAGLNMAAAQIVQQMGYQTGDNDFANNLGVLIANVQNTLGQMWNVDYYNRWQTFPVYEPSGPGYNEEYFAYQLDGEWVSRMHGFAGVFPPDRVTTSMATIMAKNLDSEGIQPRVNRDGTLVGGADEDLDQPHMVAMLFAYMGDVTNALEILRRARSRIEVGARWTWVVQGSEYYQEFVAWALPMALLQKSLMHNLEVSSLVQQVLPASGRTFTVPETIVGDVVTNLQWSSVSTSRKTLIAAAPIRGKLFKLNSGTSRDGRTFSATLQRRSLAVVGKDRTGQWISDVEARKLVRRLWPKAGGGPIRVRVGVQELIDGDVIWGQYLTFNPSTMKVLDDVIMQGRGVAIEFSTASNLDWSLQGYKLDVEVRGGSGV